MKVLSINRNLQNNYQNINVRENNVAKADFQNKPATTAVMFQQDVPTGYYMTNLSFRAGTKLQNEAAKFAKEGKVAHLMDLVSKDSTVLSFVDKDGQTLLHKALSGEITQRTIPVLNYLCKSPYIDINAQDNNGNTPLIEMFSDRTFSRRSDKDEYFNNIGNVLSFFMKFKPDVNTINKTGDTALTTLLGICLYVDGYGGYSSSEDVLMYCIKELLNRKDLDINHYNNKGENALMIAENGAHYKVLDYLIEILEKHEKENRKITFSKENLTPENNIYSEDMITNEAANLIMEGNIEGLQELLATTPLVNFEEDSPAMRAVLNSRDMQIMEMVVNYKNKQQKMLAEYNEKRQIFFDVTLKTLTYEQLKKSNPVLSTNDGFRVLMNNENFNPNDKVNEKSLFEIACQLDSKGDLANEILSKYDDVDTEKLKNTDNEQIKNLIKKYEDIGKFRIKFDNINKGLDNPETVDSAKAKFMELLESISSAKLQKLKDNDGNNALLIAAKIYDEDSIKIFDKLFEIGFDPAYVNNNGQNGLMVIAENIKGKENNSASVKAAIANLNYLFGKGININTTDVNKRTLLHYVCQTESPELLDWVLNNDANIFLLDSEGKRGCKYIKTDEMNKMYNDFINK